MHLAHRFLTHPCSSLIQILVLFMALAPWAPAPEVPRIKSSMPFFQNLCTSKRRSRKFLPSRLGCPVWIHISRKHLGILRPDLQRWNRTSAPSLHVCPRSRHVQPQHQMCPVRQDPGLHSNKLTGSTAAGSHGPGSSSDNRNTRRRLDISSNPADELARSAVLLRFPCEQYHKGLRSGSPIFEKNPTCQPTINLLRFIVRQVPCRPGLYLKHEENVKTLLLVLKMMVLLMRLTVPCCSVETTIAVRQSRTN